MVWQPEVDEIQRRHQLAKQLGGPENVARHRAAGKLTVRERLEGFLDPGSFQEIGALAGFAEYEGQKLQSFMPSNYVMGLGTVEGRWVVVGGEDFTVRGGAADASLVRKWEFNEKMAHEWRLPLVRFIDGTGGSVRTLEKMGRTYIPDNPGWPMFVTLMGEVPVVSAVVGSVAGLPAAKAVCSHWTIMVKDTSQLFVAGPPVVRRALGLEITKEELGGYQVHVFQSGVIDNLAENEADCFRQIRRFLSYLPQNVWQPPPRVDLGDDPERRDEELLSAIPRSRSEPYDVRLLLSRILDRGSLFELTPYYGASLVTLLARLDGYPVAVMANDPLHLGGAQDAASSEKMRRFIDLADTFHLPVVNFMDQPGFMVGPEAEKQGTIRAGARALFAMQQATVPWITVMLRRSYGVAGGGHGNFARLNLRYAWPSAEWGSLPIEGGVDAAYRREIAAAPDPAAKRAEIEARLIQLRSPFRTAEAFGVEDIIDPRDTRPLLCCFARLAQEETRPSLGPKARVGMRP